MKYAIRRTRILMTDWVIFSAWMPNHAIHGTAGTITTIDGVWHGKIGTDPDGTLFRHLKPCSLERLEAAKAAYKARFDLAEKLIRQAYPEIEGEMIDGELHTNDTTSTDETRFIES
jgi:hypothetical protein